MVRFLSRRRLISGLCAGVLAIGIGGAMVRPAQAVLPVSLNTAQKDMIKKAEQQLTAISSLSATFEQISDNGASAAGTVAIKRPGKMRLDYLPPTQVQIIANGTHLIYIDKELNQVSYLGLESTPAGILLRQKVSFTDPDIEVTGVQERPDAFEINVIMRQDPGAGMLTLVFDRKDFALTQWRIRDAQGVVTSVILQRVKTGIELDDSLFHYVDSGPSMPRN